MWSGPTVDFPEPIVCPSMKLLIAIGSYHLTDLVIDCLHSVAREIGSVPDTRVAVCENGTGDNFAERIQRAIDANDSDVWRKLSALPVNLSFTGGNNAIPHCIPELGPR